MSPNTSATRADRRYDLKVVVLGGGLAGVGCAHALGDAGVGVTIVDRNDYHQFQPLLYQVATSQLPAEDIARPHRTIFRKYPTIEVVTDEVVEVDVTRLSVGLSDGRVLAGSHLVIAAGAEPEFFGIPGAAEHAFPLYSVADAERLRFHLQALIEVAADEGVDPGGLDVGVLDVVVVGGGATGVEVTGALVELMGALRGVGRIATAPRITLVDRGDRLLGGFSDKSHRYAHKRLDKAGATLRLGSGVASVSPDRVELDDGTVIGTRTVVWAGGEAGATVLETAGLETGRGGRIDVGPELGVPGHARLYAVGDAANIPSRDGSVLPQLGSVAQQSGHWAGDNILRETRGQPGRPFRYKDKGIMAMIGRNAAVAEVGRRRHQIDGPLAFAAWLGVHAALLSGAHSKTDAFLSWAWDYFDRDHAALVEGAGSPSRIVWGDDDADRPHVAADPSAPQTSSGSP